jgi:hypothetical protein
MYGKVDVPLMFKRTLTKQLKSFGCKESEVDPCVHHLKENGEVKLIGGFRKYKDGLKKRFTIKELGPLR